VVRGNNILKKGRKSQRNANVYQQKKGTGVRKNCGEGEGKVFPFLKLGSGKCEEDKKRRGRREQKTWGGGKKKKEIFPRVEEEVKQFARK